MSEDFLDIKLGFPSASLIFEEIGCLTFLDLNERIIYINFRDMKEDESFLTVALIQGEIKLRKFQFYEYLFHALEHEMLHDVLNRLFGPLTCHALDNIVEWIEH